MKRIVKDLAKLLEPSTPVEFVTADGIDKTEVESIIFELNEVMKKHTELLCLAAPQIGIKKRVFCIRFNDIIKMFINPIITKKEKGSVAPETFASMPGKEILIARPDEISAVYYTDEYKYEDNKFLGPAARLFDQMAQLLDGITPDELGLVSDVEADGSLADCSQEEISELLDVYKQFIKLKQNSLKSAVNTDEEFAKQYKQLKFTENVITGKAAVVMNEKKLNREQRRAFERANKRKKTTYGGR